MSIEEELKKGDFVLIKRGTESAEKDSIGFRKDVIGFIQEIQGEYARVDVAFQTQDLTLTYKMADLHRY